MNFLVKYIASEGKYTWVDESNDIFGLKGIRLGGVLFDETNIVTVSGVNSLASVSGEIDAKIDSVSGASSIRDDEQDARLISVSGTLQAELNSIFNDQAKESSEVINSVSGQRLFTAVGFTFNSSNSIYDIKVYRNGFKMRQDPAGVSSFDYHKISDSQVLFHYDVADGSTVTIRDERTGGGGGGGGGSTDLENIFVNPKPDTNGARTLGDGTKAWAACYLYDSVSGGTYRLEVVGGVLQATLV